MNTKKWPMFEDWEEIFGKDRAIGEFAEAPLDASEEIQKSQAPKVCNDMSLGFPIDIDEDEEADAYHSPKVFTGEAENATGYSAFIEAENATEPSSFPGAENVTGPSAFTGAENATGPSTGASENEYPGSQQTHKQVNLLCGRFGRKVVAINLVTKDDGRMLFDIQKFYNVVIKELPANVVDLL
ncbi:eukaryotic initiation factor 4a-14 [Nicotiana attenuata]|uniref:Eukaryotic initiation factor 4a-14 n=1 Tax=Nicotiana attenuata TaxID=49451 RepID=A0A1J6L142_NICAT|nr:eukaryotic initiation factor 4a-14 [Nicotiana attenuata]